MESVHSEHQYETAFQALYLRFIDRYPETDRVHGRVHVDAVIGNLDALEQVQPGSIRRHDLFKARVAVLLHDFHRLVGNSESTTAILEREAVNLPLSPDDIADIVQAIQDHSKAKEQWKDPRHLTTSLLYDADKMDTRPERYKQDTGPNGGPSEFNQNDFNGYVLMVRASVTHDLAYRTLTRQLSPELQINSQDTSLPAAAIVRYLRSLQLAWRESTRPARRTIGNLFLQTFANVSLQRAVESYHRMGRSSVELTEAQQMLIDASSINSDTLKDGLIDLDYLAEQFEDYRERKAVLKRRLRERIFNHNVFQTAVRTYPREWIRDLDVLYWRRPRDMEAQYHQLERRLPAVLSEYGKAPAEFIADQDYIRELILPRIHSVAHYSPHNDLDRLVPGFWVLNQEAHALEQTAAAQVFASLSETSLGTLMRRAQLDTGAYTAAELEELQREAHSLQLRLLGQEGLRAVDNINQPLKTDRYIYFLLDGQTTRSPVVRLPYVYKLDIKDITGKVVDLHYVGVSHPQALRVARLHADPLEMPAAVQNAIHMYTRNLYRPADYADVYAGLLALATTRESLSPEVFNFFFENIIVNDDSAVQLHDQGNFVADEWLEPDYSKRNHALWRETHRLVRSVNQASRLLGIFPPLRPYVIARDEIRLEQPGVQSISSIPFTLESTQR